MFYGYVFHFSSLQDPQPGPLGIAGERKGLTSHLQPSSSTAAPGARTSETTRIRAPPQPRKDAGAAVLRPPALLEDLATKKHTSRPSLSSDRDAAPVTGFVVSRLHKPSIHQLGDPAMFAPGSDFAGPVSLSAFWQPAQTGFEPRVASSSSGSRPPLQKAPSQMAGRPASRNTPATELVHALVGGPREEGYEPWTRPPSSSPKDATPPRENVYRIFLLFFVLSNYLNVMPLGPNVSRLSRIRNRLGLVHYF